MGFGAYPSSDYTLSYVFNSAANLFKLAGTGAGAPVAPDAAGQSFDTQATSAQTALCPPDEYQVVAILAGITGHASASQQITLPLQSVIVEPNFATATGPVDTRSFAKKTLDMIEAAIAGIQDVSVQEYMINGRQLRRFALKELTEQRAVYRNLYRAELRASGQYTPARKIGFRFTRGV